MCIGIGVSGGCQCPERPLRWRPGGRRSRWPRPLPSGYSPPSGDLVEVVADAPDLPGALALDRRGRPRPCARHGPAYQPSCLSHECALVRVKDALHFILCSHQRGYLNVHR